jgi:hypothetical protein
MQEESQPGRLRLEAAASGRQASWFPVVLQAAGLGAIAAVVNARRRRRHERYELTILRKTNLTTLAVWGLWWPSFDAVAILRLGLVHGLPDGAGESGQPRGWPQVDGRLRIGKLLRAGWITVLLYPSSNLVAGVALHCAALHRYPAAESRGLALVAGVVFESTGRSVLLLSASALPPSTADSPAAARGPPAVMPSVCHQGLRSPCQPRPLDKRSCPSSLVPTGGSLTAACSVSSAPRLSPRQHGIRPGRRAGTDPERHSAAALRGGS